MSGNDSGPQDVPAEVLAFLKANPAIEIFEAILPDFNAGLRGKWIPRAGLGQVFSGGLKLPLTTLAFDVWGRDPEAWVFESGDVDGVCMPEARSLAPVPWLNRPTGQLLVSLNEISGDACAYDPRNVLRKLSERLEREHGLTAVIATEMEFYLLRDEYDAFGRPLHSQTAIGGADAVGGQTYGLDAMQAVAEIMHGIRDACAAQELPIDTLIGEAAPSQYEINLLHQPDPLLAADQGLLLQRAIKGVARQHGMRASFMAKPFAGLAGNGLHVHCSLLNGDGDNVFDSGTNKGSPVLHQAIAGCLETMGEAMLLFAPHLNSFRRFQRYAHAPLAPTWGHDNRTVAVRVPGSSNAARRLEHRVAGADANPYLVIAAVLAGIMHGIELDLETPPPVVGNAYKHAEAQLPTNWPAALAAFSGSDFIRDYLGAEFQTLYAGTKRQEMDEFDRHITALEYQTYI